MTMVVHQHQPDTHASGIGPSYWRSRLWKLELQHLADELPSRVSVCHLPPRASKWNQIEHRMFKHITQEWGGAPGSRS